MPIQNQSEANAIKEIVTNRNIKWLVHFTHVNNLASILEHGIMPRWETEKLMRLNGANFIFPDSVRADNKNASSLSIMFPNEKMLYHKRKQYPDDEWVFLLLKPDVLWELNCAFYPTNAASNGVRYKPVEELKTAVALEAMFADEVIKQTTGKIETISRTHHLTSFLPTDVQAEVLVFDTILPKYILKCVDKAHKFHKVFCDFRENINWK